MTKTIEINDILEKMLNGPKSKPFLNHLISSYYPINRVQSVVDRPTKDFKCVLTREDLVSISEITAAPVREDLTTNFNKYLKLVVADSTTEITATPKNKSLGVTGNDTTTFMSMLVYSAFLAWIDQKVKENDKSITWLVKTIKYEEQKLREEKNKHTTFTLGELDAFKKIKLKF